VVLTRDADTGLELMERAVIANTNHASLFASIHFNAIANDRKTSGVELYTFAPQFQRSTNSWSPGRAADTERDPAPVNRYDHWSVVLAHAIHRRFVTDLRTFDRGKKIAHWGVLRQLNCPGVLIECGFLTSDAEARKIATADYRQKLAAAIAAGIRDYAQVVEGPRTKTSAASARPQRSRVPSH
jgi:N-acetylmuramoyl-L-alanine amidase